MRGIKVKSNIQEEIGYKRVVKGISRVELMQEYGICKETVSKYSELYKNNHPDYKGFEKEKSELPKIPEDIRNDLFEVWRAAELIRQGKGKIVTKVVNGKKVKFTVLKGEKA